MSSALIHLVAIACVVALSGCGAPRMMRAADDMEASKAAYKACLTENPSEPSNCEGLRLAYEADVEALNAVSGQSGGGNEVTVEVQ